MRWLFQNRKKELLMLLFWPIYLFFFVFLERFKTMAYYTPVRCALDDLIPFCEYFLPAYFAWFVFMAGVHLYTIFRAPGAYRKMLQFFCVTFGLTTVIYFLWPTCQELRPETFPRSNLMTTIVGWLYLLDTPTNVCPSLHVIGSVAALLGAWWANGLNRPLPRTLLTILTVLISLSTVFLKQHSAVDVFAALPVCAIGYLAVYGLPWQKRRKPADPVDA